MDPFTIARQLADPPPHLDGPLPAVCVGSELEIPAALQEALRFQLSDPVLLVLGSLPPESDEEGWAHRQVIARICDEVVAPLARRHYLTVLSDGEEKGLASLLGQARAAGSFRLLGIKRAESGDAAGEGIDRYHSHLLTVEVTAPDQEGSLTSARLAVARALSRGIGPNRYRTVALLMGGGASMWPQLATIVASGIPLFIVEGSGGIADKYARVQEYLRDLHRVPTWGIPSSLRSPLSLKGLDLRAAGFSLLYRQPDMSITLSDGHDESRWLSCWLKSAFKIYSTD
jgi:hypothetical protein